MPRGAARPRGGDRAGRVVADGLLPPDAAGRRRRGACLRSRGLRPLLRVDARPGHPAAAVAVRGLVRLDGPRPRRDRRRRSTPLERRSRHERPIPAGVPPRTRRRDAGLVHAPGGPLVRRVPEAPRAVRHPRAGEDPGPVRRGHAHAGPRARRGRRRACSPTSCCRSSRWASVYGSSPRSGPIIDRPIRSAADVAALRAVRPGRGRRSRSTRSDSSGASSTVGRCHRLLGRAVHPRLLSDRGPSLA